MSSTEIARPNTTPRPTEDGAAASLFAGPGETRALLRSHDWAATPLGPVERWPRSLQTTVSMMLASRHPMFLFWGPDLVQLYNDAYRPSLGDAGRHLKAIGARGAEFWTEIWDIIGPQIAGVMEHGEATWHEDQLVPIDRDGGIQQVWWTYGYSPVLGDDDRIAGVLVVCQETTGRMLAERNAHLLNRALEAQRAQLSEVFRLAPGFAATVRAPDYRFELANEAYCQLVGTREVIGRTVREVLPEVAEQGFIALLDQVLETGMPYVGREVSILLHRTLGAKPEERIVDFVYQPLVEADGTRSGVLAHGNDVTEHVRARRQVEQLLVEAQVATKAKDDFLALVNHELRSPLAGIANNAQLLLMEMCGPLSEKQRLAVSRITRSQEHLLGLIEQLLDLKTVAGGRMTYATEELSLRDALEDASDMIAWQLEKAGLSFERAALPCDVPVRADAQRVRQVLLNVFSNAAKYTSPGGCVTIRCVTDDTHAHVSIQDTGIGIPAEMQEEVFKPFVQVRDGHQPDITGTGLGLAISRELARGMGGDLTVRSIPREGSTFTLTLPRGAP